jgi:hypothetical protein
MLPPWRMAAGTFTMRQKWRPNSWRPEVNDDKPTARHEGS